MAVVMAVAGMEAEVPMPAVGSTERFTVAASIVAVSMEPRMEARSIRRLIGAFTAASIMVFRATITMRIVLVTLAITIMAIAPFTATTPITTHRFITAA